jgi:transposase
MPRRKQSKRTTVKDIRSILRLTQEGLSVRAISERLRLSKTSVATYQLRARQAGLTWPLLAEHDSDEALKRALFGRVGRPPQDVAEPDWAMVAQELKRPGVTLTLLWQEYRTAHPDGFGYTWFCVQHDAYRRRANPIFRHRHEAGAVMQTDYAGQTVDVIDPGTGELRPAQIFVAVLGASSLTFAMASFSQKLADWIEGQTRALSYFAGAPKAIVCDNLKAGVVKALWFEPTLNQTFAAMAEHYDTTILPTRSRKPRDKANASHCTSCC